MGSNKELTQTHRAVTPFGGRASFVACLEQRGFARQMQTHPPWQLASSNAIPLAHPFTAYVICVVTGAAQLCPNRAAASLVGLDNAGGVCEERSVSKVPFPVGLGPPPSETLGGSKTTN